MGKKYKKYKYKHGRKLSIPDQLPADKEIKLNLPGELEPMLVTFTLPGGYVEFEGNLPDGEVEIEFDD